MADIITTLHPEGVQEDNLFPNVKDENIPSSIERTGVLLWQNANPNSSQEAGSTTISNIFNYRYLDIFVKDSNGADDAYQCQRIRLRANTRNKVYLGVIDGSANYHRTLDILSTGEVQWSTGYIAGSTISAACILVFIYGIK